MGGMDKDLCHYHNVGRKLQPFISFDHFPKSSAAWSWCCWSCALSSKLVSVGSPTLFLALSVACLRLPRGQKGAQLDRSKPELAYCGIRWPRAKNRSRANAGPWQHPLISQNCFNAVLSGVSMALKCLKLKGLVSASTKKQSAFPKHHPEHLRHPCGSASCDTGPARDPSTCGEGGGGRQGS